MSLADFKVSKLDSKAEIDKLMGGEAYNCHTCAISPRTGLMNPDNSIDPGTGSSN